MEPALSIIKKCGGVDVVALACGRAASSVHKWTYSKEKRGTGGLVPAESQVKLLAASNEQGWGLTPEDFFPVEVRSTATAAE